MTTISETINAIQQKVLLLVEKMAHLERENALLVEKNRELVEHNRTLQTDLVLKNSEISFFNTEKTAQEGMRSEVRERNHHLRTEIDQYISEIDKCIEWLQNQ